jgi:integrase
MRELFEKRLSRVNRGGTLRTMAAQLSHLIRFCWHARVEPIDLTERDFVEFIHQLQDEPKKTDPSVNAREADAVISIGRTSLRFLESVARHHGDPGLLGPEGRIRASTRTASIVVGADARGAKRRDIQYWHHNSFPIADEKRSRTPIHTASIEQMRNAVAQVTASAHDRARRHVMIKLLEVTGARRGEIAGITVQSVLAASRMDQPMLKVPTLKKRRAKYRYVPISRSDAKFLAQYAEIHRRMLVRKKLKGQQDHGYLLISGTSGQALATDTITSEVAALARAANLKEAACAHMFRHRFITKLFVALIEHHEFENKDSFRRALLDGEGLKRKVAEWTDHASLASLDRYITLAFEEVGRYRRAYNLTAVGMSIDSYLGTLQVEIENLKSGGSPSQSAARLLEFTSALRLDILAGAAAAAAA